MVGPMMHTQGGAGRLLRSERAGRQYGPPSRKNTSGSEAEENKQQQHDAAHPGPEDVVRLNSQPGMPPNSRERDAVEENHPRTPGANINRKSRSRQPTLESQTTNDQKPQQVHDAVHAGALPVREQASDRTASRDEATRAPTSFNADPRATKTGAGEVEPRHDGPIDAKGHPYGQDRGSDESHQPHGPAPNPPPKQASMDSASRDMPVNHRTPTAPNGGPERPTMLARAGKLLQKTNKKDATKHEERVDLRRSLKQLQEQQEKQTAQLHELRRRFEVQARELHHSREEYASTKQLLDDRTKELAIAQQFLTTADSFAEADVIRIVERINEEILQTAALLGETLPNATRRQPEPENDAWHAHHHVVDKNTLKFLHDSRNTADPSLVLQIAVQTYLARSCARIASAWHQQDNVRNDAFKEVYQMMRQTSEPLQFPRSNQTEGVLPKVAPSIAGRWRAMTKSSLDRLHGTDQKALRDSMTAGISTVLEVAGYSAEVLRETTNEWMHNLGSIISSTLQLRTAIGVGISSRELEVIIHPFGTQFDAKTMINNFDNGRHKFTRRIAGDKVVFCTTDLGLRSWRGIKKEFGTEYVAEVLLKPKVALQSITQDALGFVPSR